MITTSPFSRNRVTFRGEHKPAFKPTPAFRTMGPDYRGVLELTPGGLYVLFNCRTGLYHGENHPVESETEAKVFTGSAALSYLQANVHDRLDAVYILTRWTIQRLR